MRYQLLALWIFYWLRGVTTTTLHEDPEDHPIQMTSIKHAKRGTKENSLRSEKACSSDSEQLINACLQPILNYANSIQRNTNGAHFSLQGGDVFRKLCLLYTDFQDCTRRLDDCSSIAIKAVEASYGFMCGDGFKLFEKHATCFAEVENKEEYQVCKKATSQSMEDALAIKNNAISDNTDNYLHALCNIMDDYLRCCRPFVRQQCGPEAWQLVSRITMDSLHVTMPGCDINHALI